MRNSGGIGTWWNNLEVNLVSYSDHHILVEVSNEEAGNSWFAGGIYGWADHSIKFKMWDLIRSLKSSISSCCVFFGDFNEILHHSEKEGGVHHSLVVQWWRGLVDLTPINKICACLIPKVKDPVHLSD